MSSLAVVQVRDVGAFQFFGVCSLLTELFIFIHERF